MGSIGYDRAKERGDLIDPHKVVEQTLVGRIEKFSPPPDPWITAEIWLLRCVIGALLVVVGSQMYIHTMELQRASAQEVHIEVPADPPDSR